MVCVCLFGCRCPINLRVLAAAAHLQIDLLWSFIVRMYVGDEAAKIDFLSPNLGEKKKVLPQSWRSNANQLASAVDRYCTV